MEAPLPCCFQRFEDINFRIAVVGGQKEIHHEGSVIPSIPRVINFSITIEVSLIRDAVIPPLHHVGTEIFTDSDSEQFLFGPISWAKDLHRNLPKDFLRSSDC